MLRRLLGLLWAGPLLLGCGDSTKGNEQGRGGADTNASGGSSGRGGSSSAPDNGGSGANAGSVAQGGNGAQSGRDGTAGDGTAGDGAGAAMNGEGGAGAVSSGAPERVATVRLLHNLIVQDGYVYYSDGDDNEQEFTSGHLSRVSVAGGTPRVYVQAPAAPKGMASTRSIFGIVSDGTSIYWSEAPLAGTSHVAKTSIETGETVDVWSDESCDLRKPLAIDGTQIYWLATCVGVTGQLMTASTSGGEASLVSSGNDQAWKANPFGSKAEIRGLSVGNGFAMWTQVTGSVAILPLTGAAAPLQLNPVTQVSGPAAIVMTDARAVFLQADYMHQGKGDIFSFVPDADFVTAATSMVHIAQGQATEYQTSLAVDDGFVYWGVSDAVRRAPITGGDAVTVVDGLPNPDPRALAVDATHVYWADDTAIWRAPKP